MTHRDNPSAEFYDVVKDALEHLHDAVHLRQHPLLDLLQSSGAAQGAAARAYELRRVLLECIEQVRPKQKVASARGRRAYDILELRYIEGLHYRDVMQELGLSQSQYHREQRHAIELVATLLWDRLDDGSLPPHEDRNRSLPYQKQDLLIDVCEVVESAVTTLEGLAERQHVQLAIDEMTRTMSLGIIGDRTLLRQALISHAERLLTVANGKVLLFSCGVQEHTPFLQIAIPDCQRAERRSMHGPALSDPFVSALDTAWRPLRSEQGVCWRLPLLHVGGTLLVIDDNPDMVRLIMRFVADYHLAIIGAETVQQGIALVRSLQPDVILLDVMLPEHDGWEALQILRHAPEALAIPILICTVLERRGLTL
ncbi:MAG: response regulator, partial [Chloroflexi bacterium]|nr:response regulator [Chloroflexota bacterium]